MNLTHDTLRLANKNVLDKDKKVIEDPTKRTALDEDVKKTSLKDTGPVALPIIPDLEDP